MKRMSEYCKAYQANRFRAFPQWTPTREFTDDDVLFLHDSFVVTDGVFVNEEIVFAADTPEWREFCRTTLEFAVPAAAGDASMPPAQTAGAPAPSSEEPLTAGQRA